MFMSKSSITRLFVASVVAVLAGAALAVGAALVALMSGGVTMRGPDVVAIDPGPFTWAVVALAVAATVAVLAGGLGALVAWIGALINTGALPDKTWFVVLLVLGLFSLGFVAMLVYILAGPDGTASGSTHRPHGAAA